MKKINLTLVTLLMSLISVSSGAQNRSATSAAAYNVLKLRAENLATLTAALRGQAVESCLRVATNSDDATIRMQPIKSKLTLVYQDCTEMEATVNQMYGSQSELAQYLTTVHSQVVSVARLAIGQVNSAQDCK